MYLFVKGHYVNTEESGETPRLNIEYFSTNRCNGMLHRCNIIMSASNYDILAHYDHEESVYYMTEQGFALGQSFRDFMDTFHPDILQKEADCT